MSDPATPSAEAPPPAPPRPRRCRSLTVRGRQCVASAVRGEDFCIAHIRYRYPVCPTGARIAVPLLEDLETIQVVATQVAHGLFTQILDPWRAGKILYACQVASLTIARPAPIKPSDEKPRINEPVSQAEPDLYGNFLGPDVPWQGNETAFAPEWNFYKRLYVKECQRLGKPVPLTPEELPASGWLTQEEIRERKAMKSWTHDDSYCDSILQLRIDADREGKLPPLAERLCSYGQAPHCGGPGDKGRHHTPCQFCCREREERIRAHPEEDVEVVRLASEREPVRDKWDLNAWMHEKKPQPAPSLDPKAAASGPDIESPSSDVKLDNTAKTVIPNDPREATSQGEGEHPPTGHALTPPGGHGMLTTG